LYSKGIQMKLMNRYYDLDETLRHKTLTAQCELKDVSVQSGIVPLRRWGIVLKQDMLLAIIKESDRAFI
jgi:hypothetical protein